MDLFDELVKGPLKELRITLLLSVHMMIVGVVSKLFSFVTQWLYKTLNIVSTSYTLSGSFGSALYVVGFV